MDRKGVTRAGSDPRGSWATLTALLAIALPAILLTDLAPPAARAQPVELSRPAEPVDGASAMASAARAIELGNLDAADSLLRRAWLDGRTQDAAARELSALHAREGFSLRTDEAAIERTQSLLPQPFKRFESAHFVVLSDADSAFSRERAKLLERTRDQFYRVASTMGVPAIPHAARLVCVLFDDVNAYRVFAKERDGLDAAWIGGYFSASANRIVFYNHATSRESRDGADSLAKFAEQMDRTRTQAHEAEMRGDTARAEQLRDVLAAQTRTLRDYQRRLDEGARAVSDTKTIHECVHLLAFNSGVQRPDREYTFWIREGLAMAFESERPGGLFGPDRPSTLITDRLERYGALLDTGKLLPLSALVAMGGVPNWDESAADAMYAQSHTLFLTLYKRDPAALGSFLKSLGQSPLRTPEQHARLFAQYFGDPAPLEATLRRLSLARRSPTAAASTDSQP